MSTEARRASVPPRPDVPPRPGVPPRPTRPPGEPTPEETAGEPPEAGTAEAGTAEPTGTPGGGTSRDVPETPADAPSASTRTASPTPRTPRGASPWVRPYAPVPGASASPRSDTAPPAPRFPHPPDAMAPPPPPASARFPDTPPPADRQAETGSTAAADRQAEARRPAGTDRPAGGDRSAARRDEPTSRGDVPFPGRTASGGPRPDPTTDTPRPTPPAGPAPARPLGFRPVRPERFRATGTTGGRTGGPTAPRPAESGGPRDTGATGATSSRSAGPGSPGGVRSDGPRAEGSAIPRPTAPAGPRPAAESADESAWSPLPRSWVPAPGRAAQKDPDQGSAPASGQRPAAPPLPVDPDAQPAWSPASPVRHPDFAARSADPDTTVRPPTAPPPRPRTAPAAPPPRPTAAPGAGSSGGVSPDPALSWSAPMSPGGASGATRPVVTFARPEGFGDEPRRLGRRTRTVAAAACLVLGLGLIGGAVTGSWLIGDAQGGSERGAYTAAGGLWHNVPVDDLFPVTIAGQGAGPGGADRIWTRVAVAPDSGCADAFDPLLSRALAPVGCQRLLRATYTDATQSYVTTVGLLFTTADANAMRSLETRFDKEGLAKRTDLMPRPYAAKGTVAAAFGDKQRASWTISVLTDAPVVVYSVSGWADGRTVDAPQSAQEATASGATTAPAQAGLGNEAQGLADRVERALRKIAVTPPSEQPG
ncbi:hypothetical protein [Streptomyces sp. NPDC002588]|uniref:hypothetical protein n=1 Tax=Streptomyces sp. NPDC002588 TaxID=3154419 RepID=UPI0033310590